MLETETFADEIDQQVGEVNSQKDDTDTFLDNSVNKDL